MCGLRVGVHEIVLLMKFVGVEVFFLSSPSGETWAEEWGGMRMCGGFDTEGYEDRVIIFYIYPFQTVLLR